MASITIKQFRALNWERAYSYGDKQKGFDVYGCGLDKLSLVHDWKKGKARVSYRVNKRSTDSPAQAVKWYNAEQRRAAGGEEVAGSPQSIAARKGTLHRRGDQRAGLET